MGSLVYERLLWYVTLNVIMLAFILLFTPLRFKKVVCIALAAGVLLAIIGLDYLRFAPLTTKTHANYLIITFVEILIVQGFSFTISQYHDGRSLFTGLSASNLVLTGYILGIVGEIYSGNVWINVAIGAVINIALLAFLIITTRKPYLNLQQKGKSGWLPLCLIPVCYYLLFYFLTSVPLLLADKPYDIPAALLAVGGMIISYVVAINYVSRQAEEEEVSRNKALLEAYMKSLSIESATIEQAQSELAILRHDMRHYISMISVMLADEDYEGVRQIIGQVNSVVDTSEVPTYCENPILNSTMQALALKADQEDVTLKSSILISSETSIPYIEFSAVIANLVENALDAASHYTAGEQVVNILIQPVKNQLVVEVSNPTENHIPIDSATGLPRTESHSMHGIGLKSVKDFVERHEGMFYCSCDNYLFTARLSIPLEP